MPEEMRKFEYVVKVIKGVFKRYGFDPVETPAFENWELLKTKCGEEVERQIYKFEDKGGRELGLRFDLTVPLARIIANNPSLPKPFKRYQISRVWRYERPEAERRFREFWQADIDIVGSDKTACEAEVLAAATDCLKKLGFNNFQIRLNNRKVLEGFAETIGIPKAKRNEVFRIIDKIGKIDLKDAKKEFRKELLGVDEREKKIENLLNFVEIKGKKGVLEKKDVKDALKKTIGEAGLTELQRIIDRAEDFGVSEYIMVDLSLARGLDYYTGSIFEISVKGFEDVGSVVGGGRYDNLIDLYGGRPTPAVGISLGIDRIVKLMERKDMFDLPKTNTKVFLAPVNEEMIRTSIKIAQILRKGGVSTEVEIMGRKLLDQLKYADKKGIKFAVIVGESEVKDGYVVVRNMKTEKQERVRIDALQTFFKDSPQAIQRS